MARKMYFFLLLLLVWLYTMYSCADVEAIVAKVLGVWETTMALVEQGKRKVMVVLEQGGHDAYVSIFYCVYTCVGFMLPSWSEYCV